MASALPGYLPPPPVPVRRQLAHYARGVASWRPDGPAAPGFLIFAQGRSGSTLLTELLNASPQVTCDREILERRVVSPSAWAEASRLRHRDRVYGFKVKPLQLLHHQRVRSMEHWLVRMHRRGWRIVHLERRNLLRQTLSNIAAERYGFHRRAGSESPAREPLHVDPAVLTFWMGVRAEWLEQERAALGALSRASVFYEDDLRGAAEQQATLDRLTTFLGVASGVAKPTLQPANAGPLRELIANYDEVREALEGSPWSVHLDED